MKKRLIAIVLTMVCVMSMFTITASAKNYTGSVNTFDIYQSGSYHRLTSRNSGVRMVSTNWNGTSGYISIYPNNIYLSYSYYTGDFGNCFNYKITSMKEGGNIKLYLGSTCIGNGKIHTNNGAKTFGSIVKLDSFGGGYYFKYSY